MSPQDPFGPVSGRKKVCYAIAVVTVVVVAAIILGGMEGGFSPWQLINAACVAGIPAFLMLALIAWLSSGERSENGVGPANVKLPIRFVKAMPYIVGAIALFYLVKMIEA